MLDYDIVRVFRPLIVDGLQSLGIDAKVLMNYQPTKQGINNNTVYFFNIGDKNIGAMRRENIFNADTQLMESVETQTKETKFQINTIVKQDPSNLTITAKDLCTYVHMILNRRSSIDILNQNGLGLLWVTDIRNTPFKDSDDNYSFNPSFDITITHEQQIIGELPIIDNFNCDIKRI